MLPLCCLFLWNSFAIVSHSCAVDPSSCQFESPPYPYTTQGSSSSCCWPWPARSALAWVDGILFFTSLCVSYIIYLSPWHTAHSLQKDLRFWRSSVHSRCFSRAGYLAVWRRHREGWGSDCAQITSEEREKCCFCHTGVFFKERERENRSFEQ